SLPLAFALAPAIFFNAGNYLFASPSGVLFWQLIADAFLFQFEGDPGTILGDPAREILGILLVAAAVLGALSLRKRQAAMAIVLTASFLPLLLLGLITFHTPVWVDRYLLIATPAFTLMLAIGLACASSWRVGRAIAATILVLTIVQLADLQN